MTMAAFATTDVELNDEGFFVHPGQWTEAMVPELARLLPELASQPAKGDPCVGRAGQTTDATHLEEVVAAEEPAEASCLGALRQRQQRVV